MDDFEDPHDSDGLFLTWFRNTLHLLEFWLVRKSLNQLMSANIMSFTIDRWRAVTADARRGSARARPFHAGTHLTRSPNLTIQSAVCVERIILQRSNIGFHTCDAFKIRNVHAVLKIQTKRDDDILMDEFKTFSVFKIFKFVYKIVLSNQIFIK